MKKDTTIEVKIQKVGYEGIAIGTLTEKFLNAHTEELASYGAKPEDYIGKKVLVNEGLLGETLSARLITNKKKYMEAEKIATLEKSPFEIPARCPHIDICKGCTWQNLDYTKQLEIKKSHIAEAFKHMGNFEESFIESILHDVVPCKKPWNYRNKVEFTFGYDANMNPTLGYHVKNRRYDIFTPTQCDIIQKEMLTLATEIFALAQTHRLRPFSYSTGEGFVRSLVIRSTANHTLINLIIAEPTLSVAVQNDLIELAKKHDITSLCVTGVLQKKGEPTKEIVTTLHGTDFMEEEMKVLKNTLTFEISASSFFQTNTTQAQELFTHALKAFSLKKTDTIIDLFCGTGVIGLLCAPHVKNVIGIELNPSAIENAKRNALRNDLDAKCEFIAGDVARLLDTFKTSGRISELKGKKIIVDPPRSGLTPAMIQIICEFEPKSLLYISCNPVTQARDLKEFCAQGYVLDLLQPVDMFPHTYHIENIAVLEKL